MPESITPLTITGRDQGHLQALGGDSATLVHRQVVQPLASLQAKAARAGIDLQPASGFRSFERQLAIWNGKAAGHRPVMDDLGNPIDVSVLSDTDKVFAILRWSALPGASRHHWGTDLDVWDKAAVPADYRLQLTASEYCGNGPLARLGAWLDEVLDREDTGFTRPYREDKGGVGPEPWHISYQPVARDFERMLTPALLVSVLQRSDLALKSAVLANLDQIFDRFVRVYSA